MTSLAVTGYASLDYVIGLAGMVEGDRTTLISSRDPSAWPGLGGCPAYAAMSAADGGHRVYPISWIGSDASGDIYLKGLSALGVHIEGVSQLENRRSPAAILAYQVDGSCACLYDPAFSGEETLTSQQSKIIGSASHLCITVGPPHLMQAILECRRRDARLYWVLKNDSHCFTPAICDRLSGAADVIFCNAAERGLIQSPSDETVIVETRGAREVFITHRGRIDNLPVEKVALRNTTGAGDTFAGGFIAAEMSGVQDPLAAARKGVESGARLLKQRLRSESS